MENDQARESALDMTAPEMEEIEVDLLIEAIFQRYGYDFRHYARSSLRRRVQHIRDIAGVRTVSEIIPLIMRDEAFFSQVLREFSVTVTEMFRDPPFFVTLREKVIPYLRTWPFAKIWEAGCATGECAYSLAILLEEEGMTDRTTIFATDFNTEALAQAREGIYPISKMREYTINYQAALGKRSFSEYYHAGKEYVILNKSLRRNISFAEHNLAVDTVFSELHFISCRNVLIYFDKTLQSRTLELFHESLVHGGILALGSKESIRFTSVEGKFETVDDKWRIYKKI